jgi:splicing factor 45
MSGPPRGLSLYDNLLDPNDPETSTTISSAPVLYTQTETPVVESTIKKPIDPALRFQPIRRPQVKQPTKPKAAFPKTIPKPAAAALTATTTAAPAAISSPAPAAPHKSTLADWAATEDDEWQYGTGEKRQRGGRRKKKKRQDHHAETDWNELYDPTRPTNVEEYLRSDEKISEVREWKALLYRHRKRSDESDLSDEDEHPRPMQSSEPIHAPCLSIKVGPTLIMNRSIRSPIIIFLCTTTAAVATSSTTSAFTRR